MSTALAKYLARSRRSHTEFAEAVGAHRSQIHRCASGERRPDLELAVAIERETAGAVPVESWVKVKSRRAANSNGRSAA